MAPADYHMFRLMQHGFDGMQLRKVEEVQKVVDGLIAAKPI